MLFCFILFFHVFGALMFTVNDKKGGEVDVSKYIILKWDNYTQ